MGIIILIICLFFLLIFFIQLYLIYISNKYAYGTIIHKTKSKYIVQDDVTNNIIKCFSIKEYNIGEFVTLMRIHFNWYIV